MASQQQQARPMFRFASMLRPAGAPQAPPPAPAAPQPMFRPPVAAPFRPPTAPAPPPPQTRDPSPPPRPPTTLAPVPVALPPQTRDPSPPPRPPTAPAPPPPIAPAPPQPVAPPPVAPALRSPPRVVLAPLPAQREPVVQPRFTVGAPPPAEPRPAATIPPAPKSPATRTSVAIPAVQDSTRPFQLYQAPKPATSSRSPPPSPRNLEPALKEPNQHSPKVKPVSPLKLPPAAQFKSGADVEPRIPAEIDQKTVVVQERSERNRVTAQKFNATQRYSTSETDWTGKREGTMTKDNIHHKKRSDTEEPLGMSILTLAGENKGAMMELSPARANKHGFTGNPRRLQKEWSDGEKSGKESEEEGKFRMGEKNNNPKGMESMPMTAFMNSNVQGVNNSVLHNASCTHHDPGVHLIFSRKGGRYTKEAHRLKN